MLKHILVPLDGSGMAEAALPAAAFLSEKFNAAITLFHVIEKNAPSEVHGQPHLESPGEAESYLREKARTALVGFAAVDFHVHTAEAENVAESIIEHAQELNCDIIVMCSHGRGRALHLFLGSIAEKVISKGLLPVLVTRPSEGIAAFSCRSLLVPLDGDPDHEKSLEISESLATACGATVNLLMVIPSFGALSGEQAVTSRFLPGTMSKILEISARNAEDYINTLTGSLRREGISAEPTVLRGDPGAVIADSARDLGVDLIILATHGKAGMEAFWRGSVAHKVSSLTHVPLLLIPVMKT